MTKIKQVKRFIKLDTQGTYVLLISPEHIPHVVLIHAGEYYSLTHKKAILAAPFDAYFSFLKRTKRKMLFLKLDGYFMAPQKAFEVYDKATEDRVTCLNPVRDCVMPNSRASFIYELIPELYDAGKIEEALQVNMDDDLLDSTDFTLSTYTKEAIFSYIQSLNQKYAKRS